MFLIYFMSKFGKSGVYDKIVWVHGNTIGECDAGAEKWGVI